MPASIRWVLAQRPKMNTIRPAKPGYFGWPYFVGNNKAYNDLDFATNKSGAKFDPAHPVNNSPNNTGLQRPPTRPARADFLPGRRN